jgi:hypothetical protein
LKKNNNLCLARENEHRNIQKRLKKQKLNGQNKKQKKIKKELTMKKRV